MLECGGGIKSKRVWERKKLASEEQQRWSSRRRARQDAMRRMSSATSEGHGRVRQGLRTEYE
jgi:hypothetical protein